MSIPYTDEGYAVEPSGVVHRRYADHAMGAQRTRSLVGALSLQRRPGPVPALRSGGRGVNGARPVQT